ncbi:MAG: succinate dehydrogenase iron-sulfur subunit [Armatimonadota bacterium]
MEITFKIFRFNPEEDKKPYYKEYKVEVKSGETVLDALNQIKWYQDGTLAYRRSCRSAICGSCAMKINGINRLACKTQVFDLKSNKITVDPLPKFRLIRDLIVDMDPFFDKLKETKPYLINYSAPPEKEREQSIKDREKLDDVINCILCGGCTTSCPSTWTNNSYLGPAAFNKSYRFVADTRDEGEEEHLESVNDESTGIWRCHGITNCFDACPKNIDITKYIGNLKMRLSSF